MGFTEIEKNDIFWKMEKYVYKIFEESFSSFYYMKEELLDVGFFGIIENIDRYDPEKGAYTTFFRYHIYHNMYKESLDSLGMTPYDYETKKKREKAEEELRQQGESDNEENVARKLGMRVSSIRHNKIICLGNYLVSFDQKAFENMQANSKTPEQIYIGKEDYEFLYKALSKLDDYEKVLFVKHFAEKETYDSLAEEYHKTHKEIKKICSRAMTKVRKMYVEYKRKNGK